MTSPPELESTEADVPSQDPSRVATCPPGDDPALFTTAPVLPDTSGDEAAPSSGEAGGEEDFGPDLPDELATRFEVLRELGKGGMGRVLLCRDRRLGREVALKCLFKRSVHLDQLLQQEAVVLAGLEHENVVRLYDSGHVGGKSYLVMEFVRGSTLAARLASGRPTVAEAVRLGREIVAGVLVAQERGIVHLDLKPGNIFLDGSGRARVADFGLARALVREDGSVARAGSVGGTPAYMAPEQRAGVAGFEADVYAVGVILHEMLTGQPLFAGLSELEMLRIQGGGRYDPPSRVNPSVPAALDELVLEALDLDPEERPSLERIGRLLREWEERAFRHSYHPGAQGFPSRPYRFLEWFGVEDAPIFFGRNAEIAEMAEILRRDAVRMMLVFGPCGIGKSSMLRAGLARALDPELAEMTVILAGPDPARKILEALVERAASRGVSLDGGALPTVPELEADPLLLRNLIRELKSKSRRALVLVLDQTEEVFTQNLRGTEAPGRLFELLARLVETPDLPLKLVIAYRTEFRGEFFPLEQRLARHLHPYLLTEIREGGLQEAIEGPSFIEAYGFSFEPDLAKRMALDLQEAARENGTAALPGLQILCRQMHDRMQAAGRRVLRHTDYLDDLGGARGALQRYVEERLASGSYAAGGSLARQILEALTLKEGERERFSCAREENEVLDFPDRLEGLRALEQLIADRLVVRDVDAEGNRSLRLASEVICGTIDRWAEVPDPAREAGRLLGRGLRLWIEHDHAPRHLLDEEALEAVLPHAGSMRGLTADAQRFLELSTAAARSSRRRRRAAGVTVVTLSLLLMYALFLRPGELALSTRPPGARVTLAGAELGITPLTWSGRPGMYTLSLSRAEHDPVEVPVVLGAGGRTVVTHFLPYTRGVLRVTSEPPGASCRVSGPGGPRSFGPTPVTTELIPGDYELEISLPGYEAQQVHDIRIEGNRLETERRVILVKNMGWLAAGSTREGATLILTDPAGGRVILEQPLPIKDPVPLPAGRYRAECSGREGRVDHLAVDITPRTTTTLSPWIPALEASWQVRGFRTSTPPAVGDLDGDGRPDLVYGAREGGVHAVSGATGAVIWSHETGGAVLVTPALGDLDHDGWLDVVASSHDRCVHAISGRTGHSLWKFRTGAEVQTNPALADLDRDGTLDVVAGSCDASLYALEGSDGSLLWSFATAGRIFSDPRLVDVDGDGVPDAIFGSEDGQVRALSGIDGRLLWAAPAGGAVSFGPWITRVDGDAVPDVMVVPSDRRVRAFSGRTGRPLWATDGGEAYDGLPTGTGDADGDGLDDIAVVTADFGRVVGLSGKDGRRLWSFAPSGKLWPTPVAADLDGEPGLEVVVATPTRVHVLSSRGEPLWGIAPGPAMTAPPALADLEGGGSVDLLHVVDDRVFPISSRVGGPLWSFQTGVAVRGRPAWMSGAAGADPVPDLVAVTDERWVRRLEGGTGRPRWSHDAVTLITSEPRLASLDGDAVEDVVVGQGDGQLRAVSGARGELLWKAALGGRIESRPVRLEGVGEGASDIVAASTGGEIAAFSGRDGRRIWRLAGVGGIAADLLAADIDRDGSHEVVAGGLEGRILAVGRNGKIRWRHELTAGIRTPPTFQDPGAPGVPLILVGSEDGQVVALDAGSGRVRWEHRAPAAIRAGPVVLDGAGPRVVFAESGGSVRALSAGDGSLVWIRKREAGGFSLEPAAVEELDGDGIPDLLLAHRDRLVCLSGATGTEIHESPEAFAGFEQPVTFRTRSPGSGVGSLILVGGATSAVVATRLRLPVRGEGRAGDGALWRRATGSAVRSSPATGDLAGDGRPGVVVTSSAGTVTAFDGLTGDRRWIVHHEDELVASPVVGALRDVGHLDGVVASVAGRVRALDGRTGAELWSSRTAGGLAASPALVDGDGDGRPEVLVASRTGHVTSLAGADGRPLWSLRKGEGFVSSPVVTGDGPAGDTARVSGTGPLVLIGSDDGRLLAFAARDGAPRWEAVLEGKLRATPAVASDAGAGGLVVLPAGHRIHALTLVEGRELWRADAGVTLVSSPVLGELDADGIPDVVVGAEDGHVLAFSGLDGKLLWKLRTGDRVTSRPVIVRPRDGGSPLVVAGSFDGLLHAIEGATGARLWARSLGSPVDWSGLAAADLDADGSPEIVAACQDGSVHALQVAIGVTQERPRR